MFYCILHGREVHPPDFSLEHALSDWPDCWLETRCACRMTMLPVRLLMQRHGSRSFRAVLAALRCSQCEGKPAPVYLVAGTTRTFNKGRPPDWTLELVPPA